MPLTNVRDLVNHASDHGYMVASFNVHASEEIKALVAAAEACRAPVILAIDKISTAFLDYDIAVTIAESMAARSRVPVAIEVVSDGEGWHAAGAACFAQPRRVLDPNASPRAGMHCEATAGSEEMIDHDVEYCLPPHIAGAEIELGEPWTSAARLGIGLPHGERSALRPGTLRKHIQAITNRFDGALVVNGDLDWPEATLHLLPHLGIAKVNFDRRLHQTMAKANRQVASHAQEDYRRAMEHVAAALMGEVSACLRRVGATGRAADVLAFASHGSEKMANSNKVNNYRPARRYRYDNVARSGEMMGQRRATGRDARSLHVQ